MARKRGMQFIPYDYEAAYNKAMEDMHEWFIENLFQHRKKVIYALKEITAGDQFEIEIYPQFRSMDEVPPEGRTIKKDNNKAQKNLNDKNARKYVERLINENFSDRDIWMTLTYDDAHLPPDGDVDAAIKNVQKYIRRINYQRKKRGLPNAKYVYVTAYNPDAEIRWHHHIVMDGALDMETVESCWKQSSRNEVRRLQTDENGLSGMANYIVEEKNRVPSEKRWNSSQGLRDPRIKVVHSKRPAAGGSYKKIGSFVDGMVKDRDSIPEILKKWYPDMDFTNANVYYNDFNCIRYMDDMVVFGKNKKELHRMQQEIERFLREKFNLQMKGNWQVFRFDYTEKKTGKRKGRPLDFMGFQFYHDKTILRESIMLSCTRKVNRVAKKEKITWYDATAILSYMGYLSNTDTYDMYLQRVKPYVNVKKLKKIVSKHSKRKEREKHERMERSVRNGGRTAGGVRHNSVTDNGISETQYQESNERGCRRKENHRMAARGA